MMWENQTNDGLSSEVEVTAYEEGILWGDRNVLYPDLDAGYMGVCTCQNPSNSSLKIYVFSGMKNTFFYFKIEL